MKNMMEYRLIRTPPNGDGYGNYRVEFSVPAATQAYNFLVANNPRTTSTITAPSGMRVKIDRHSPFWAAIGKALAQIRPQHADEHGNWVYVDGQYRPYEHSGLLMSTYAAVIARLQAAVPTPYLCAGSIDGCVTRVPHQNSFCASCAHDND